MLIPESYNVNITIDTNSAIKLALALLIVGIIILTIWAIARKNL